MSGWRRGLQPEVTQTAPPYSNIEALKDKHKPLLVRINAIGGSMYRLQKVVSGQIGPQRQYTYATV